MDYRRLQKEPSSAADGAFLFYIHNTACDSPTKAAHNMLLSTSNCKGGALLFLFSLLSSLLLFSSQASTALAAPIDGFETLFVRDKDIPDKAEVEKLVKPENLDDFSKYAKKNEPGKDKSVYFTGQSQQDIAKIVKAAQDHKLTSVRNIWKNANFYTRGQYKEVDDATFREFQKAFSRFYAKRTEGKAYLIFPHDKKPSKDGVFYSTELPEIIDNKKVDEIVWIDQNKLTDKDYKWEDEKKIYWKKGDEKPDPA
ncbi:hypothetical protein LLEC1_03996 [Akanthomyces lecanii]|uniref:Uncharacterized protein n=1 Tax=Cordyceps confragosa TaxID=2714763 RepID=A0A179IDP2_CORDF|nr:hypothetical protein LLEC1_03996 [Akanthomyces lecanii]